MLLPIFSPKVEASDYSFLQPDLLNKTNQLIDAVNNGHEYWLFTEEECYFLYEKKSNLLDMRYSLVKRLPRKKKFQFTKEQVVNLHQAIERKQQWQIWLSEQSVRIQDSFKKSNKQHEHLKKMWENQQDLVYFNHRSICAIASEILPKLIKHHDNASQWLEWQKILYKPKQILLNYDQHITHFQHAAKNLQASLANTMLLRLIACDESYFTTSSPVKYFTYKLADYGLVENTKKIVEPDVLTGDEFNYFHWYIEKYGSAKIKERLLKLTWYKNTQIFPCKLLTTEFGNILVPEQIASGVPRKQYWPDWFFRANNLRLKLAQNSTYLVAMFCKRRQLNTCFVDLTLPQSYQYLVDELLAKERYLKDKIETIGKHRENYNSLLSSLLFDKTKSYLSSWQNMLEQINLTIFEDRLLLGEMLIDSVRTHDEHEVIHLDKHYGDQMEDLIAELERTSKSNKLSVSLENRLQRLMARVSVITSFNKSTHIFDNIVSGISVSAYEYDFLTNYIHSSERHNLASVKQFQNYIQLDLMRVQKKLLSELKSYIKPSHDNDIFIKRNSIICCHLLISKNGTDQMKQLIDKKIKKYFFNYLQDLILTIHDGMINYEKQIYLEEMLEILKAVGDTVSIAGKTISQHLHEIHSVRDTSKTIWQLRCYGLIMILADKLIEKRFNKEATLLDEKLFGLLQNHERLRYSDSTIKILQKTRGKLIDQQLSCAAFAANLPKAEQILMGVNYPDSAAVQDIMLTTAEVYKTQKELRNTELDTVHKIQKIEILSQSVNNFLRRHPLTKDNYAVRSGSSGVKPWFTKHYLKEEMIIFAKQKMNT